MSFGRPGRPPEDVPRRRAEIFVRVSPLLAETGVRGLSMRTAAKAAGLWSSSTGGGRLSYPGRTG
jgi:hypothetical protein